MASITLEQAEEQLAEALTAISKVRKGQTVDINGQRKTMADMASLQADLRFWNQQVLKLTNSGRTRVVEVIPR